MDYIFWPFFFFLYFNRGIMMAILVNTVSMGIEHHQQASVGRRGPWGLSNARRLSVFP